MKTKKLLALSLAGALSLSMLAYAMPAFADGGEAEIGGQPYATLADAIAAAQPGDTVTLMQDAEIGEIDINTAITLDLNGFEVTSTTAKAFEIYADATIEGGTISAPKRCVDTRTAVELTLEDVDLIATGTSVQPITIGGSDAGTELNMTGCTVTHGGTPGGDDYALIVWVPANINIEDSSLDAWAALYMKEDASGSVVYIENSDLTGTNYSDTYSFGTVVLECHDVEMTVDGDSEFTAANTGSVEQPIFMFSDYDGGDEGEDPDYTVEPNYILLLDGHYEGSLTGGQTGDDIRVEILGGSFTEDPSDYLADGCVALEEEGIWEVASLEDVAEAALNGEYYLSLTDAVADAEAGDTVTLMKDIVLQGQSLIVDADDNFVLDLNGFELSAAFAEGKASATIINKGELRIEDNSSDADGVITTVASNPDTEWAAGFPAYANNTITNQGRLTVAGGTVENSTSGGACYAIDNNSGASDAMVVIEGGAVVHEANNFAIRQFANSTVNINHVQIEGGEVSGKRAVWIQLPGSAGAEKLASLTVTGGTLTSTDEEYNMAVYSYTFGDSFAQTYITVEGGTFNGDIALTGGALKTPTETISVTGGTFNGDYGVYSYGEMAGFISGGKFKAAPDAAYIAEGLAANETDGYYVIGEPAAEPEPDPEPEDPAPEDPDEEEPTPDPEPEYTAPAPSTGSSDGWKDITDEVASSDKTVIDMNGTTVVPEKVLDAAADAGSTVTFDTGKASWTIDGSDLPEDVSSLSLRTTVTGNIPAAAEEVAESADEALSVRLSKTFESNGVKADLTVNIGKANAGKAADIYAVGADGEPELITSVPVAKDGSVTLPVEGASQYIIAISDEGTLDEGWQKNDRGDWVYGGENGTAATGWYYDHGHWYYSDENGIMQTGAFTDSDGKEYYLNPTGEMRTGWFHDNGKWTYYAADGAKVKSGWVYSDGSWYYLKADGTMLTDAMTPDGYYVDPTGKWAA